jgi:hypothetical protein
MTISNELMVGVEQTQFVALRPDSELREALLANLAPGETLSANDLPRVPTPTGGGKTWQWLDSGNNEQSAKAIEGALVYVGLRSTLWGSEEPQTGTQPVLQSYDCITATRLNDDIGDLDADLLEECRIGDRLYDLRRCAYNKYGTGKGGIGKRCKESRVLAILRPDEAWPLLVSAGPGSLKTVCPFVRRLPVPHFRAFVSLTLQKVESAGGQSYSQIVPKLIGTLTREEGEMLRRLYTEPLSKIATQIDVPQDAA